MTSFAKPTPEQIRKVLPRMASVAHREYFLSHLDNPEWISVFKEHGFMNSPPEPILGPDKSTRFPRWPMSMYLARMARISPREVLASFCDINTKNISILHDMLRAAKEMPPTEAAHLSARIIDLYQGSGFAAEYDDLVTIAEQLSDTDQTVTALRIFEYLFKPPENERFSLSDYQHYFAEASKSCIPNLARRNAKALVSLLTTWTTDEITKKGYVSEDSTYDLSHMWRPAIEEHDQNSDYELMSLHVGGLRLAYEAAIDDNKFNLTEVLADLASKKFVVFHRLRMHLINRYADRVRDLAVSTMMDRERIEDPIFRHEYALLVGNRWTMLEAPSKSQWLSWIDEGPEPDDVNERTLRQTGRPATNEELAAREKFWKFEKLHWIRNHLDGELQEFYKSMLAEHGEPQLSDLSYRVGPARWVSDSPIAADELAGKSLIQALEFVKEALSQPLTRGYRTQEGIGGVFRTYIKQHFPSLEDSLSLLPDPNWVLIWEFLEACQERIKDGAISDPHAILQFGLAVAKIPFVRVGKKQAGDTDYQQWARSALCQVIERLCVVESGGATFSVDRYRGVVSEIIQSLHNDGGPSGLLTEKKISPLFRDYLDEAINSPRGKAVQALLEYGRWVISAKKTVDNGSERLPGGLASLGDFLPLLEWHLVLENKDVHALAVIGTRLNLLTWADPVWAEQKAPLLFGFEATQIGVEPIDPRNWAAWNSFLVWVNPNVVFFKAFHSQFISAIEWAVAAQSAPHEARRDPMDRLGEHLVMMYGRGGITLDQDGGAIRRFFTSAELGIRTHAIAFIGGTLEKNENIPTDILDRLTGLWKMYWAGPGKSDAATPEGRHLFGEWFSSGALDVQWTLTTMLEYVSIAQDAEPDHLIVERLRELVEGNEIMAVKILGKLIDGDSTGWRIHSWMKDAKEVLRKCFERGGESREIAKSVIDRLGRRGFTNVGDLLRGTI